MGVRPPANDDLDEPESVEFGIVALDGMLSDAGLSFPTDRETVASELGHRSVPYDAAGRTVELADVLEAVDRDRFETKQELLDELYPVFEDHRNSPKGLLSQLRSLVPF
ncbi:DUF5789 family protein [Halapricum desulfuricans]|uniref:Uncharacterized protein n=1 Tax=Halapricum desulfuricans TaxID=2841257 RepID=A0A897N8F4_9EURY|nr:hypothetical protein [Halapricum desulfuricans]QSG08794.1 Uncharacterized protein HSR122_1398 [Halapricum desulfuricans]QSG11744.1 Uncharacterized protein HSBGL_1322 [Halapricum desulfuricans]